MAGKKRGPAKGSIRLTQEHRDKISNSKILQRLISHAEGALPKDKDMSQSQVTAAIALLKKVLPDQTIAQVNGAGDAGEHLIATTIELIGKRSSDESAD